MLKQVIGLALVALAWFDPLKFGMAFRVLLFILGFDLMSLILKVVVFLMDYFFELSGLGWTLLLLIAAEALLEFLLIGKLINLLVKPLAVFAILYLNGFSLEMGVIIAGIDLLLNIGKKRL